MADEEDQGKENRSALGARDLESAINSPLLLEEHAAFNGSKVRTRFPPEPNGYLHVGHAKSMNMNFELAFEKLGVPPENRETIFRYDDTNPEAESKEYIQSLREDVDWLGWKPIKVTYTSDYFQILYDLAVKLIKNDKAYVCHQSKADIEASREIARAKFADPNAPGDPCSPWRNRPVADSLKEFENMKKGKYAANEATLRLKMDMYSPNPNMWDQVAYRIKYMPHPHAGDAWCIYPTYDYTHCIIDSLEHIDYSICTLEFETRRESYYWVLQALDLYRPKVYEMSRLNISYTVLSKRKLLKLVTSGYMRGWNDPRMPTIKGLRRRGYSASILNAFCREIGATRNANLVQYERLASVARNQLHLSAPRCMAVLQPLKVILTSASDGVSFPVTLTVPDFPFDTTKGSHPVLLEKEIFIDRSDFRLVDSDDYFGLAPNKAVNLKYAYKIRCDEVQLDAGGEPTLLRCSVLGDGDALEEAKPKGTITWVSAGASCPAEVRVYNSLFLAEEVDDLTWEAQLNPTSEIVYSNARCDSSLLSDHFNLQVEKHLQFERLGFFVVDQDSSFQAGSPPKLVFNLTVTLKDSKPRDTATGSNTLSNASRSRKEEQAKQLAEKMARMAVSPQEMFRNQPELYSQFDEDGIPTHDAAGEKVSKSASKKLRKEWEKQKKLFESASSSSAAVLESNPTTD